MEAIRENEGYLSDVGNSFFVKVFARMFLGLLLTAALAYYSFASGLYIKILSSVSIYLILIAEIAVVLIFNLAFKKLSPGAVTALFYIYAAINGITLGSLFLLYEINTIFFAFLTTAALFGGLALYGYTTDKDVSKMGPILAVTLIIGIVFSIINIFMGNTMLDIILDWVMLFIFAGLTIFDMNKLKNLSQEISYDSNKLYIYGAMELYLDFINMFLRILRILARSRRK